MEYKINIAEILRNCPQGMELNCTMYDNLYFNKIHDDDGCLYKISCYTIVDEIRTTVNFTDFGTFNTHENSKCVIFPKGKTTWEGFVPPCEFKDGDIIFTHADCLKVGVGNTWISIFQEKRNSGVATYVDYAEDGSDIYLYNEDKALLCMEKDILRQRLATEEEKQKLFDAIKANGYRWNAVTKTLEKLIVPKFKVGDRIVHKVNKESPFIITEITNDCYKGGTQYEVLIEQQNNFELVPYKFDINSLVPFESKVLVRNSKDQYWIPAFWGYQTKDGYVTTFGHCNYCIPYEGNEHLLGTTGNCNEFYKTWE